MLLQSKLVLHNVSKSFYSDRHKPVEALKNVNLEVASNEFVSVVGPSGCGKSTLLMMIAGLEPITSGIIQIGQRRVTRPGLERSMVFQSYSLFPWLTVVENIAFALRRSNLTSAERRLKVDHYIERVGLQGFENAYPNQLSGGMRQRVAIARAMVHGPQLLLMDEPFGALDAQTRMLMQELLLHVWEAERITILFVTHDVEEAILLSDRIYIMTSRPGQIREEVKVGLARPRGSHAIPRDSSFLELRQRVLGAIREEAGREGPPGVSSATIEGLSA